jgi:hypothetical protein
VRDVAPPGEVNVLGEYSSCFGCDCGAMFAVVLDFRITTDSAARTCVGLHRVRLLDITVPAFDLATGGIDFAPAERSWLRYDHDATDLASRLRALAAAAMQDRAAFVTECLRARFAL